MSATRQCSGWGWCRYERVTAQQDRLGALRGSTSETVRGSTESHLTRPGMEPAILGLPGTCRGRKLGDKPTVDIGSTSIFMQSPISFAWLRTRPVRRPHWISNPYSRTDKSEAAADGRTSESAPSFRLGVLLLLPQLAARIRGRREDRSLRRRHISLDN